MKMNKFIAMLLALALCLSAGNYQAQAQHPVSQSNTASGSAQSGYETQLSNLVAQARPHRRPGFALMPSSSYVKVSGPVFSITPAAAGPNLSVLGSGTLGRLTKWTGLTSSNSFIGDSSIYESKSGLVGIGTDTPSSKLTVMGLIETTLGGFKFPDGTVQTSSATGALVLVAHDATLTGNGTAAMPLGVAVPLVLSGAVAFPGALVKATNTADGAALFGESTSGVGVRGESTNGFGVLGFSSGFGFGVSGESTNGFGVLGLTNSADSARAGILAQSALSPTGGVAGIFMGNVRIEALPGFQPGNLSVAGTLSKGAGAFKIDHPLDPENKYLYHSFVESPDMKNIYDGVVMLDDRGEAVVELPQWFQALNNKFRYQLTCIGGFAPIYVAEKIADNRFRIAGGQPGMEISWMVTGIRRDAFAKKNRIPVEEEKPEAERGYYLHPEAFDQPQEKSIQSARDPEGMQQLKKRQLEAEQMRQKQPPNQR